MHQITFVFQDLIRGSTLHSIDMSSYAILGCDSFSDFSLFLMILAVIFYKFYWSIVDLQCCFSFRCTAMGFKYIYIFIYIYMHIYIYIEREKAMAPHSSTLAWKIPWMEEPGRLQSMGSHRVGHDWATSLSHFIFMHWRRKWQPTPVFLPGESRDGEAWWAAVHGVTQSRTRLKWLSCSIYIYIYIFILVQILFSCRLSHNIEYSSLCYTVGPCWLYLIYSSVCVCQSQAHHLSLPPRFPFSEHKFVFSIC